MTVNGVDLEFSLYNPKDAKKFNDAQKAIVEVNEEILKKTLDNDNFDSFIETMTDACNIVTQFFDDAFGDGTANKVFGKETDLEKCMDAFNEVATQMEEQAKRFAGKLARFQPQK